MRPSLFFAVALASLLPVAEALALSNANKEYIGVTRWRKTFALSSTDRTAPRARPPGTPSTQTGGTISTPPANNVPAFSGGIGRIGGAGIGGTGVGSKTP